VIRSLRKGSTTVELWYKYGSESIAAKNTEVELMPDYAVFRTTLKPVDGNQKDDADNVLKKDNTGFNKISFSDQQIHDIASKFLNAYDQIKYLKFELIYEKKYCFNVSLELFNDDGLIFIINA